ncbi:hypothetical protein Hanom_Chr10g00929601 [Helianthus anomalus]
MNIQPMKRAIFNGFMSVFSPSVTVFKMINFTLGNECKPLLANSFSAPSF